MNDVLRRVFAVTLLAWSSSARAAQAASTTDRVADDERASTISEDRVVELAARQNPTLASALVEVRRADLLQEAEEHRYGFVLQLDGSVTRQVVPNAAFASSALTFPESTTYVAGGELRKHLIFGTDLTLRIEGSRLRSLSTFANVATDPPTTTQLSVGPNWGGLARLSATQPLLRGAGREVNEAQLRAAEASRNGAVASRDQTASQLLLDALSAYWELYYATRAREIQERSLELARAQLDDTERRVKTGSLASVEALSFETRVATLEEDLTKAEAEEQDRSTALARQLGDVLLAPRRADTAKPLEGGTPGPRADQARVLALSASYDVRVQEEAVRLAEVQARTAADALRPRLDLEGWVQAQGLGQKEVAPVFQQIGTFRAVSMYLGVTYELPLDDTQRKNEKARAELAVDAARSKLEAVKQRVVSDLDVALRKERTAQERITLAERSLEIARRQVEAETTRFRTGSSTALVVREAEDQVRSAELRVVRAEVDLTSARQQIAHLTGRLLARVPRS